MAFRKREILTPDQEERLRVAIIDNDPTGFAEGLFSVPETLSPNTPLRRMTKTEARTVGASFLLGRELGLTLAKKNYLVKTAKTIERIAA